ncbi:MAG: CBS domain-containing protein [Desulfuromonadales bacterium]|nr:CBS domain-containing protein [Desulfuromonadales bacterium]
MKQTIGKFATHSVAVVEVEATVQEALQIMSDRGISCIVVLSHNEPIGILTERDVVFAANWLLGQSGLLIKEVMNKPVMTASEDMTIAQAYRVFCQHKIRHLVILDARLDMAGIFTQTDLVRSLKGKTFDGISDVSCLMSPQILHVASDVPARYALSLMARRSVSCVVVMEDNQPVGMFTERDVVRCVARGVDLSAVAVGSVMTPTVVSTTLTTTPHDTIGMMLKNSVRRLLVVDEHGGMAGILTQTDIGRVLDHQESSFVGRLLGVDTPLGELPQGMM